jgi:hypothetical protein
MDDRAQRLNSLRSAGLTRDGWPAQFRRHADWPRRQPSERPRLDTTTACGRHHRGHRGSCPGRNSGLPAVSAPRAVPSGSRGSAAASTSDCQFNVWLTIGDILEYTMSIVRCRKQPQIVSGWRYCVDISSGLGGPTAKVASPSSRPDDSVFCRNSGIHSLPTVCLIR